MQDFLTRLREANVKRCQESYGHNLHGPDAWPTNMWALAVGGEVGELLNFVKKEYRGDGNFDQEIADEVADVIIYLDLFCAQRGLNLADVIADKFNRISIKRNCEILL